MKISRLTKSLSLGLLAFPTLGSCIAFELTGGAGVENFVVRVYGGADADHVGGGTGSIISVKRDASGPGGWICVLTADHVVANGVSGGSLFSYHSVAFGDVGGGGPIFDTASGINAHRGLLNIDGSRVDLGLLGVRVADLSKLPTFTAASLETADYTGTMFMDGYGFTGTFDGPNRRYLVNEGTYGIGYHGFNGVDDEPVYSNGIYTFDSLHSTTLFGPSLPFPAIQAEAHVLNGDSGGPSLESSGGAGGTIFGVHSHSVIRGATGSRTVNEGDDFWDVRVASYEPWIQSTCNQVVPEPASLVAVSMGMALLLRRRRS